MNIAHHLPLMAAAQPAAPAIKIPRPRVKGVRTFFVSFLRCCRLSRSPASPSALRPFSPSALSYLTLTFAELHAEVLAWQHHLATRGVRPGDRVLVMVRQGLPLIASVFALFAHGAVPVIIDPGMGLKSFLRCVAHTRPRVLLAIPLARVLSYVCWRAFRSVEIRVLVSGSPLARAKIPNPKSQIPNKFQIPNPKSPKTESELAAILFTSGSTGAPKGVLYDHSMFEAQVRSIRAAYGITPGEVDLSMLPVFALFAPALGMTTIVPELDPSRPATLDPAKIVQAIQQERVTNSFGSPTLWNKIADYCIAQNITLPTLKRVLCAGAPVPASLWEKARIILPNGQLHSPYGATECLPVSTISADEMKEFLTGELPQTDCGENPKSQNPKSQINSKSLPSEATDMTIPNPKTQDGAVAPNRESRIENRKFHGSCVGLPTPEIQIKIIAITDAPIPTLSDACELPPNEIGEIIVTGPAVTREYDNLPAATAAAKIQSFTTETQRHTEDRRENQTIEPAVLSPCPLCLCGEPNPIQNSIWHRMGDTGYLDTDGRLWFCGRKAERVETPAGPLHTEPCEQIFRAHPQVFRCALIGLGDRATRSQPPAIVVQPAIRNFDRARLTADLRALAQAHPHTQQITHFYFHPNFPVDVRHNAKIHRLALAKWAARQK